MLIEIFQLNFIISVTLSNNSGGKFRGFFIKTEGGTGVFTKGPQSNLVTCKNPGVSIQDS